MLEREEKSAVNSILTLNIKEKDYQSKVEELLKDYKKKASLPGFRKGMTPMGLIKNKYEIPLKIDEVNKIIQRELYGYIQKEELNILGSPIQLEDKVDWNSKDLVFKFEIGLSPKIKVDLSKIKIDVNYFKIKIDDRELEEQIKNYQERLGEQNDIEEVKEDSYAYGIVDFEGEEKKHYAFHLNKISKENSSNLLGKKINDNIELSVKGLFKDEDDLSTFLQKSLEDSKKDNRKFNFTIEKIFDIKKHEVNQELFDKVLGKDKVKSEEEFKNELKNISLKSLQEDADKHFLYDVMEKIVEQIKFETPDDFLKKWIIINNENVTQDNIEDIYEREVKILRKQIIESEILKDNNVEIKEEDLLEKTKEILKLQMAMYGGESMPDDKLEEIAKSIFNNNKQESDRIRNFIITDKLLGILIEKLKYDEKEVTFKEYLNNISVKTKK